MKERRSRLLALFVITLAVMVAALAGQTVILARASGDLMEVDHIVETDIAPALVALDAAEGALDTLEHGLAGRLRGQPRDLALQDADIDESWTNLQRGLASYLALPIFPGEPGAQLQIRTATKDLERFIDRVRQEDVTEKTTTADLAGVLEERAARLRAGIHAAMDVNAEIERMVASRLHTVRSRYLPFAFLLDTICALAAAAALAITYSAVHKVARRADELEVFAGRIAHDLMSPLMTVTLAIAAVGPCVSESEHPRVRKMLARASGALQHASQTIADLLAYARAGARPSPGARADTQLVLDEVASDFSVIADDKQVELTVESTAEHAACCSPGVLRSVVGNLVQNAIKYIGGGTDRRVSVRALDQGRELRIEVEDTGPGIPKAEQDRIFEPYVRGTEKGPGVGLGLATVKQLVEAHGGRVGVKSDVGRGACFWVMLPSGV